MDKMEHSFDRKMIYAKLKYPLSFLILPLFFLFLPEGEIPKIEAFFITSAIILVILGFRPVLLIANHFLNNKIDTLQTDEKLNQISLKMKNHEQLEFQKVDVQNIMKVSYNLKEDNWHYWGEYEWMELHFTQITLKSNQILLISEFIIPADKLIATLKIKDINKKFKHFPMLKNTAPNLVDGREQ